MIKEILMDTYSLNLEANSSTSNEGERKRGDAILCLPQKDHPVVDGSLLFLQGEGVVLNMQFRSLPLLLLLLMMI